MPARRTTMRGGTASSTSPSNKHRSSGGGEATTQQNTCSRHAPEGEAARAEAEGTRRWGGAIERSAGRPVS
jgi:hypothetical protein